MKFTKPGRTVQNLKHYCDINQIIKRAQQGQPLPTVKVTYGSLPKCESLLDAKNIYEKAHNSFNALPSEIRSKFNNNPVEFFNYANNPDNLANLCNLGLNVENTQPQIIEKTLPPVSETAEKILSSD